MRGFFSETLVPHFSGRMARNRFWAATVMYLAATTLLGMLWRMLFWQPMSMESWNFVDFVTTALFVYLYIVLVSFLVRRLHDFNRSGWWVILWFIPILTPIVYIVVGVIAGDPYHNRYGPARHAGRPMTDAEALASLERLYASGLMSREEYETKKTMIYSSQGR